MDGRDTRHVVQVGRGWGPGHLSGVGTNHFFNGDLPSRDGFFLQQGLNFDFLGRSERRTLHSSPSFLVFFLFIAP
jgi:hypothetical protein